MRRVERLIKQVRRATDNEEFNNDQVDPLGITTQEISEFLNEAQDNIKARISEVHPKIFIKTSTMDLVAGQELYNLPSDLYLNGRILNIEAKFSNQTSDYTNLRHKSIKSRLPNVTSEIPSFYIKIGDQIAIQPTPSRAWTDGIRLTYQKKLPSLGFRIGQVSSVTTSGTDTTIISLNASPTKTQDAGLPALAEDYITQFDELTVVNKKGVIQAAGLPVSTYDSVNQQVTLEEEHALSASESITAGDYLVGGSQATTVADLPDTCERYLIAYAAWKVLKTDSMVDSKDQERELAAMLSEIVAAFKEVTEDPIELLIDQDWVI